MPVVDSSPNGGAPMRPAPSGPGGTAAPDRLAEKVALPAGSAAPGAARLFVAHCLSGLVSQRVLADAVLLVSELITNSVRHGELGDGDTVLLGVSLDAETLRLEIENPGIAGAVESTPPDRRSEDGGFGLALVGLIAARWGVSRADSTKVWFEMRAWQSSSKEA